MRVIVNMYVIYIFKLHFDELDITETQFYLSKISNTIIC